MLKLLDFKKPIKVIPTFSANSMAFEVGAPKLAMIGIPDIQAFWHISKLHLPLNRAMVFDKGILELTQIMRKLLL